MCAHIRKHTQTHTAHTHTHHTEHHKSPVLTNLHVNLRFLWQVQPSYFKDEEIKTEYKRHIEKEKEKTWTN